MNQGTGLRGYARLAEAHAELEAGRTDSANAIAIQHLREHRGEPRGLALLGAIALRSGALVQAEQFLRQAIAAGLTNFEVQRDLASAINQQERSGEALRAFSYLADQVSEPQLRATKALILDKLGRTSEALVEHELVIAQSGQRPDPWISYGNNLRAGGRIDEAITAYRRATAIEPEHGEAWWALANIKSRVLDDNDISAMEQALSGAVDLRNVVPLHFALGRAYHDREDHAAAFDHFTKGNDLRAESIGYRSEELTAEVDEFIVRFDSAFFARPLAAAREGPTPVFVISLPRSGSTLLEQMLDRHSGIEAVGELPYIRALLRSAMEIHTRSASLKVPDLVTVMSAQEREAFGADYLNRASLHRTTEAPYFVDKMPMNWSDVLFIRQILPQARFIDIRRPAMDCCFSNYIQYFSRAHAASFRLEDMGRCYVDYVRLMDHLAAVAPGLVHPVDYGRLVEDPKSALLSVLVYLGLAWEEPLLTFHESERAVRTPSAEQVRRPLNRSGFGVSKPYAQWLQPLRDALGPLAGS